MKLQRDLVGADENVEKGQDVKDAGEQMIVRWCEIA